MFTRDNLPGSLQVVSGQDFIRAEKDHGGLARSLDHDVLPGFLPADFRVDWARIARDHERENGHKWV